MHKSLSVGHRLILLTVTLLVGLIAVGTDSLHSLGNVEASLRTVYTDRTVPAIDLGTLVDELHRSRYRMVRIAETEDASTIAVSKAEIAEIDRSTPSGAATEQPP